MKNTFDLSLKYYPADDKLRGNFINGTVVMGYPKYEAHSWLEKEAITGGDDQWRDTIKEIVSIVPNTCLASTVNKYVATSPKKTIENEPKQLMIFLIDDEKNLTGAIFIDNDRAYPSNAASAPSISPDGSFAAWTLQFDKKSYEYVY